MDSQTGESREGSVRCLMVEPTGHGSHDRYTHALVEVLIRNGVDVDLLTSSGDSSLHCPGRLLAMKDSWGFEFPVIGLIWRKLDRAARLLVNHRRMRKTLAGGHYDVVHLQILNAVFLPSLKRICQRMKTRLVVTPHNIRSHYDNKKVWNGINRLFFARFHNLVDAFVAHTPYHRLGLIRDGVDEKRIHVVPFGPHPGSVMGNSTEREAGTILMAGGLRVNKGPDTLLEALKILDRSSLPLNRIVKVHIVGRAADKRLVHRIAVVAGELRQIVLEHVNRYLAGTEYSACFARSQILVLPYTRSFFSLSAVLLDGYFHDNELVVTDAGANGETVREDGTGIVVPPEDPVALAEALKTALIHGADPSRSANRRRSLDTRFNWSVAAQRTASLYRSLLS